MNWLKSTSVIGILTALAGVITSPDVLAILPPKVATVLTAIGAALGAFGIRRRLPAP